MSKRGLSPTSAPKRQPHVFIPGKLVARLRRQTPAACQPKPVRAKAGGASRDRTGDLKLAKLALSQLSYGPEPAGSFGSFGFLRSEKLSVRGSSKLWWAE